MTHQQMEIKIKELEKRIYVLEQASSDCRICKKWNECPCGKEGHKNGNSIGYSVGECREYEQEPFKPMLEIDLDYVIKQKYIERDVLDKIRAEIDRQEKWLLQAGCTAYNVDIAFDAIKSAVGRGDVE